MDDAEKMVLSSTHELTGSPDEVALTRDRIAGNHGAYLRHLIRHLIRQLIHDGIAGMGIAPEGVELYDWRLFGEDTYPTGVRIVVPQPPLGALAMDGYPPETFRVPTAWVTPKVSGHATVVDALGVEHNMDWRAGWDAEHRIGVLWMGPEGMLRDPMGDRSTP